MTELYLGTAENMPENKFCLMTFEGQDYHSIFLGTLNDLADELFADGISKTILNGYLTEEDDGNFLVVQGRDVYFVINPLRVPPELEGDE